MTPLTCRSGDPAVRAILNRHPRVGSVAEQEDPGIWFADGAWSREVRRGDADLPLFGLLELMDNNPLVCADSISVPSAAGTLALLALGPAAAAGLLLERPAIVLNTAGSEQEVEAALRSAGWTEGADIHEEPLDLGDVLVATGMAVVETPADVTDLEDVYEERFGRSFFVRRTLESDWRPDIVQGTPFAAYRLSLAPDLPTSLLTIRVMADRNGKCGAAQLVHAMNVMCGFEETLGIA